MDRGQPFRRTTTAGALAAAIDMVAIVLFVAIGRRSHHHADTVSGLISTLWPFAVGLGAGWVTVASTRHRLWPPLSGALVCAVTVAVGMVVRVLAGQGTAAAFVGVALGFLGAVMVGGRLAVGALHRPDASRE